MTASPPDSSAAARRRIWWIVVALSLGPAVTNGFARFAYGLILPSMQTDLGWSFTQAGWINTANAIGYLAGAVLALLTVSRLGVRRLFIWGMALTTLALAFSATTRDLGWLSLWRILAGIGGAPTFIAGGAMASALFPGDTRRNALALAVYFGGGGFGMFLTAITIPLFLDWFGPAGWPLAWLMLGIGGFAGYLGSLAAARRAPEARQPAGLRTRLPVAAMLPVLASYTIFGMTYVVYITFLVAWMEAQGAGAAMISFAWAMLSLAVLAGPLAWRRVLARSGAGGATAATSLFTGLAILMPVIRAEDWVVIVSAALFGMSFFMVPTSVTNFCRKNLPQPRWGSGIALMTVVFSIGQIIGPVGAGVLADRTGGTDLALVIAGATLIAGGGIALLQTPLRAADTDLP